LLRGPQAKSRERDFAKFKKLAKRGQHELKPPFDRLAKLLKSSGEVAEVQFDIIDGRTTHAWSFSLEQKTATASNKAVPHPDVRLIVSRRTWQEIAEGNMSPLGAFLSGKLRIRGDIELARRLYKRVALRGPTDLSLKGG
jgi:putative sterol carrier protein